jgi:predicted phosphate transport protein (TIGR00153 family)
MKLDGLLQILVPKDKKFFPLFEKASGNLVAISEVMNDLVNTPSRPTRKEMIKRIEHLEHTGDGISHQIFQELSASFITPFDREDIHTLTSAIDDVVDNIHGAAKRMELYNIDEMTTPIVKLAELILKGAQELNVAVCVLKNMKNIDAIKEACVRINSIENHADDIFDNAIASLFESEKDAIKVIKMKEILSALETATDKCEDAANVLSSIIIKYA